MKTYKILTQIIPVILAVAAHAQNAKTNTSEEQVIERYLKNGAWHYGMFSREWQLCIDSGISINPNIAYLYQQKAMPYFKQGKYEVGLAILDKAVQLDPEKWIDYRAFIKCIFSKQYKDSMTDFIKSKAVKGEHGFVMDHSYDFYIALCYLMLNDFQKASDHLKTSIAITEKAHGESWVHHLDLFYLGVACYEQQQYENAVRYFNRALTNYDRFSDAEYYKALSLHKLGKQSEAVAMAEKCKQDFKAGYTINEDNAIYERYPYQISQWLVNSL
jgi:tetratricopeptide (TPR) repeat protein